MGFVVCPTLPQLWNQGTTNTVTLPTGIASGDKVILWCSGFNGTPAVFGIPSGYTVIGSQTLVMGGLRYSALFQHDWVTGDPTTFTLTGGMTSNLWLAFILRADGALSLTQDNATDPGTATSLSLASFGGSAGGTMRLALLMAGGTLGSFTPPTPAKAGDNPSATGFVQMIASGTGIQMEAYYSVNPDDSGWDANASAWTHASAVIYGRGLTWKDGGSRNGANIGLEIPLYEMDAAITARNLDEGAAGLSQTQVYGGGANLR